MDGSDSEALQWAVNPLWFTAMALCAAVVYIFWLLKAAPKADRSRYCSAVTVLLAVQLVVGMVYVMARYLVGPEVQSAHVWVALTFVQLLGGLCLALMIQAVAESVRSPLRSDQADGSTARARRLQLAGRILIASAFMMFGLIILIKYALIVWLAPS